MSDSKSLQNLYFKEISKSKQLTKEEEVTFFKKIESLKKKKIKLDQTMIKWNSLSGEVNQTELKKISKSLKKVQGEIAEYKNALISSQYFLVVKIAKRYRNRYLTFFDILSEGNIALVELVDKFDYKRGFRFSSFIYPAVKNAILRAVLNKGNMIREPIRNSYGKEEVSLGVYQGLNSSKKIQPFIRDGVNIGVDSSRWLSTINKLKVYSFEDPLKGSDNITWGDRLSDDIDQSEGKSVVEEGVIEDLLKKNLEEVLKKLTDKENKIIKLYYGLDGSGSYSFAKISKSVGLSSERVSQIHELAINKLKNLIDNI